MDSTAHDGFGPLAGVFESLSGQLAQMISKFDCCGIHFRARAPVPVPQPSTQPW